MKYMVLVLRCVLVAAIASPICAFAADPICDGLHSKPAVVIPGGQPQALYYCDANGNATSDIPIHLKNASTLMIVVKEINPLQRSFTVSINGTKYAEVDGSALTSSLGIPSVSSSATQPGTTKAPGGGGGMFALDGGRKPAAVGCTNSYDGAGHLKVVALKDQSDALQELADGYKEHVSNLQNRYTDSITQLQVPPPTPDSFLTQFKNLAAANPSAAQLSVAPKVTAEDVRAKSALADSTGKLYTDLVVSLSKQAIDLHGSLPASDSCADAEQEIAADKKYLETLFDAAGSASSLLNQIGNEVKGATAAAAVLAANIATLQHFAADPRNFEVDVSIPPEDRIQNKVTATVSWTDTKAPAPEQQTGNAAGNSGSDVTNGGGKPGQTNTKSGSVSPNSNATGTTTFTLNFGEGARVFQSAGIVFSPLAQHTYVTASAGSSPACPTMSSDGNTKYMGCIVDNGGSGWRLLPMALVSVRIADLAAGGKCYQCRQFLPRYVSLGATIKQNSSSSTTLEYLIGPSWSTLGQHLFITAGGYAGAVNTLGNGLVTGPQTSANPSTLPISSPYRWGFGFAISYGIASQGGTSSKGTGTANSTSSQPTGQ